MTENKNGLTGLVLTGEQIKGLAEFAVEAGQPSLTISHGRIGLFDEDGTEISTEYKGLVAFSPDNSFIKLGPMQSEDVQGLKVILAAEQVENLATFAKEDGQPKYCITHTTIPAFTAEDDREIPEYTGLIAYSESTEHGVLQLD